MPTPLQGTSGIITVGGTNIVWIANWESTLTNNTASIGPHIGDPTEYTTDTSQKDEFKISGTIPSGGDPGQNALFTAARNRTTSALVLEQTLGKVVTYSAAKFTKAALKVQADGSQTFDIEGNNGSGTAVISQDT
jgi:hypothetical protein